MEAYDLLLINGELNGLVSDTKVIYKTIAILASQASLSYEFIAEFDEQDNLDIATVEIGIEALLEKKIIERHTEGRFEFQFYKLHKRLQGAYAEIEVT